MKRIAALVVLACFARSAFGQSTLTPNISLQIPAYQQQNWQVPLNFDLSLLDTILGGVQTLAGSTTPTVGSNPNFVTANTSAITVSNFVGGFPGQTIRIICGSGDTFTAVSNSATIKLAAAWSCASNSTLTLTNNSGVWTETARSGGAAQSLFYQTIQNGSGAAQTQRPIVEFTGTAVASVTDDSANNRTVVTLTASAGSGVTLQTNGTNNSSQTALNLQNSSATNGLTLTFSNPSGGNVQAGLSGTLNDAGLTAAYSGVGSCAAHQWVNSESRNASPGCAQPAFSDLSGTLALASQVSGVLAPGNEGTGTPSSSNFLRGDGTWATVSAGVSETVVSTGLALTLGSTAVCTSTTAASCVMFVLPNAHTLVRSILTVNAIDSLTGCSTHSQFGIKDLTAGSVLYQSTASNTGIVDSGALSVSMPAGHQFLLGVTTQGAGCGTYASAGVAVVYQ